MGGSAELHTSTNIIFPKLDTIGEAVLLLVREKTSRFATVRDPFFLDKTIICSEQDWDQEYFEIHEFGSKDSYIFKADEANMTATWYQALQFYSQCLGGWRRRRKGLGNIMVDPNLVSSTAAAAAAAEAAVGEATNTTEASGS